MSTELEKSPLPMTTLHLLEHGLRTPGDFDRQEHFYPQALNAQVHPTVQTLFDLGNDRIAERYIHLHPEVEPNAVRRVLATPPRYFHWGGSDLFHVTTETGERRIMVIETNSCPSGQKSMPLLAGDQEEGGYRRLLERTMLPMLKRCNLPEGELAVLYDKTPMEASGYAATLAELTNEPVHLVPFRASDPNPPARFTKDKTLEIRAASGDWIPIRAGLRYVTQRPWTRIPAITRTALVNPVITCLAGGRNKMLAAKAYDLYNGELLSSGLSIWTPETIWDVSIEEIPLWIKRMGGFAVVKAPYSNSGQGVYTITNNDELEAFMNTDHQYGHFIVQALIGNHAWSSRTSKGKLYQIGTVPDREANIYVADMRFMVGADHNGFYPLAIYARRARKPLPRDLDSTYTSWEILGTNLSVRLGNDQWTTEPERLMLADSRDFNHLGCGLDDLIEGYIQSILAMTAIDRMAQSLVTPKGRLRKRLFHSLNPDDTLHAELYAL